MDKVNDVIEVATGKKPIQFEFKISDKVLIAIILLCFVILLISFKPILIKNKN